MIKSSPLKQIATVFNISQFEWMVALFLCAGAVFYVTSPFYFNSDVQRYFQSINESSVGDLTTYNYVSQQINSNEYVANATVFAVWAVVGLLSYYAVYYFSKSEHNFSLFVARLFGGKADVASELEEAFVRSSIRIGSLSLLLMYWVVFKSSILPFAIVNMDVSGSDALPVIVGRVALGMLALLTTAHIVVVLLRGVFLRQRLFFNSI